MSSFKALIAFLFCATFFIFGATHVSAQGAGIKILPAFIDEKADPNQVITQDLVVTNVSGEDKTFYVFARNIKGVEDSGTPIFATSNEEVTGYDLIDWLSFAATEIQVKAGQEYHVPLTITVPENASPGSHFAGVFVSAEAPKLRETGAGVGYEVASIVHLRISGEVVDSARVRSFSTNKLFFGSKDVEFLIKVENQGSILVRPRGPLTITNMFGSVVANITVNDSLAGVFPKTVRDFNNIRWTENEPGFGQYQAIVALSYDGDGGQKTIDATVTFWIFPLKILIPALIAFAVIILLIYVVTRMYIARVVGAQSGRRIVSRRYRQKVGISRIMFVLLTLFSVSVLFIGILLILFA